MPARALFPHVRLIGRRLDASNPQRRLIREHVAEASLRLSAAMALAHKASGGQDAEAGLLFALDGVDAFLREVQVLEGRLARGSALQRPRLVPRNAARTT